MTAPITPPPAPTVPPYPALGSPDFNQLAYTYATSMPGVSQALGNLSQNVAQNTQISHDNAVTAVQAANAANEARDASAGAINFKGVWSGMSGPLSKPASVKHNGRIWLLLNNLTNVAASEPGVSADWTTADSGSVVQNVSTSSTLTPGPVYVATTAGITLTVPASMQTGDVITVRNNTLGKIFINWRAFTLKGDTPVNPMPVPAYAGFSVVYNGSTFA